jgi:hexosaminidase
LQFQTRNFSNNKTILNYNPKIKNMRNVLLAFLLITLTKNANAQHTIIPEPVSYESNNDIFVLGSELIISINTEDEQANKYSNQFKAFLENTGIKIINGNTKKGNSLSIKLNKKTNSALHKEGYKLVVTNKNIALSANEASGIFNGLQTLRQLLPAKLETTSQYKTEYATINGCTITDYPRFKWRGLMLDVSRHFFTVDEVKTYIDKMSQYKFNVFHWHLSDDQGWRIEIKSLPKLTEVGAWRVPRNGRFGDERAEPKEGEKATYGGFYTQEEIKDVVKYAAERNITIVPELDLPGHCMAVLAAYPELSTKKEPKFVSPGSKFSEWYGDGTFKMLIENTLNPADEKVYEFVDKVFTEVAALFPGEYIHMGGDECYHGYWDESSEVQKFMKKNNIDNSEKLQSYFVKRVEKIISNKGKKMIGWNEILLGGGLAKNAAVMSWQGTKEGIEASQMGHNVVMSPTTFAYLDYTQGDYSVENRIYASLSLEKSYNFDPVPEGAVAKYIMGGQGNLWTEAIPTLSYAFYMAYPRAFALSETFWSPKENKIWENFIYKTEDHFKRFDVTNYNISKAVLDPIVTVFKDGDKLMCKLTNSVPETEIFYTIDNTYPVKFGEKYSEPFEIPQGNLELRTQTFRNNIPIGRELLIKRSELEKRVKN